MTQKKQPSPAALTCMAEIVGVHGIRGMLKLKVFCEDPETLLDLSPLCDDKGNPRFEIDDLHPHQNIFLATFKGIADRTQAEKLRGTKLYVDRGNLPDIDDEDTFYHADLIGLAAKYPDGRSMGTVIGVANFGAGDLLDIKPAKGASFYVPFRNEIVPSVDLDRKEIIIDPPEGLIG